MGEGEWTEASVLVLVFVFVFVFEFGSGAKYRTHKTAKKSGNIFVLICYGYVFIFGQST